MMTDDDKTTKRKRNETQSKSKKNKKKSGKNKELGVEDNWICSSCNEAELPSDPDAPLLICDGTCLRVFHAACIDAVVDEDEDSKWVCEDCTNQRHMCIVCGEYGIDDKDVFKCSKASCGLFFHQNCLVANYGDVIDIDMSLLEKYEEQQQRAVDDDMNNITSTIAAPKLVFKCPAHKCSVCAHGDKRDASFQEKSDVLYRCLKCPLAFHSSCIHPAARWHELALLCQEHRDSHLPRLDAQVSMQSSIEGQLQQTYVKKVMGVQKSAGFITKKGASHHHHSALRKATTQNAFIPMNSTFRTITITSAQNQAPLAYRMHVNYQKEVHSKPPIYKHVNSLKYGPQKPKRLPPSDTGHCDCKLFESGNDDEDDIACGESCLNRISFVECVGNADSKGSNNPYVNCLCGPNCGNRLLSRRKAAKCRPMREGGKGWGLVAPNGLKVGQLAQEYLGEVINEETMLERLKVWNAEHPNDHNFYVMELGGGWFIDAREYGNLSRFINHSCDPNCKLVPFNVGGWMRIAIICIRDVAPGEFLSYDYRFDTSQGERFLCLCGGKSCRGTMKGASKSDEVGSEEDKTRSEELLDAQARMEKDRKFLEGLLGKKSKERLNGTGPLVPGALSEGLMDAAVANGPQISLKKEVQAARIFLWRNVILGADFESRLKRLYHRRK